MPKRVQRTRTKGGGMPPGARYVGRPGPFGNPFHVEQIREQPRWWRIWPVPDSLDPFGYWSLHPTKRAAILEAVIWHRAWLRGDMGPNYFSIDKATYHRGWVLENAPKLLGGCDLACWCAVDQPCHVDTLIKLAAGDEL